LDPDRLDEDLLYNTSGELEQGFEIEGLHTPSPRPFPDVSPLLHVRKSGGEPKVLGPVVIGENVVIGANPVITKDVPLGMVAVGANRLLPNKGSYWRGKA
jgi:hypothetical protein